VRPEGLGKFKISPHRVSNPRPSGLQSSALVLHRPSSNSILPVRLTLLTDVFPVSFSQQSEHRTGSAFFRTAQPRSTVTSRTANQRYITCKAELKWPLITENR
jgi:hypothetical protein